MFLRKHAEVLQPFARPGTKSIRSRHSPFLSRTVRIVSLARCHFFLPLHLPWLFFLLVDVSLSAACLLLPPYVWPLECMSECGLSTTTYCYL